MIVRFAGDSGDGMQLAGGRFTDATAALGNDLATLPNFPAEIRAPAGTLAGVSAFQIHFAARDILTPGRQADHAGGDESRRPALEHRRARARRHADRQRGGVHRPQPPEGGLHDEPARGRVARRATSSSASRCSASPSARWRAWRASARATPSAPATSSRSGSCAGSTTARPRSSRSGSRPSSRPARPSWRPTAPRSAPATRSATRPSRSTCATTSRRPPTSRPAPTARSTATPRSRSA